MPAPLRSALLPTWAVFEADLARAARSWIVRAWCLLFALQGFFTVLDNANRQADGVREIVTSQIAVPLIRIHVVVWSSFIILVGALGLTAEAGSLADGVLSRGINRYQYFLAKLAARHLVVFLITFVVLGAVLGVCGLKFTNDLDRAGTSFALGTVAAASALLVSVALVFGSVCRNSLAGIAAAWIVSYALGAVLTLARVEHYSPAAWLRALPDVLTGTYESSVQWRLLIGLLAATVVLWVVGALHFSRKDI